MSGYKYKTKGEVIEVNRQKVREYYQKNKQAIEAKNKTKLQNEQKIIEFYKYYYKLQSHILQY